MRIPIGDIPYHEACALVQDWLCERWTALVSIRADAAERANTAAGNAATLRAAGGAATCVMRL